MLWLIFGCSSEPIDEKIVDNSQIIGQQSIIQLLQVDPLLLHQAWTESMNEYSDEFCPVMEVHNGMDLWRESCTTETGNQFLGWALNLRIEHIFEDSNELGVQDWISGQARIVSGDIELSNYGDILHQVGIGPLGQDVIDGMVFGNFYWTDPRAQGTWLSKNINIEYLYHFERSSEGWNSSVDAWLSNFDSSYGEAVIWEDIQFNQSECSLEPVSGMIWIRHGEGNWTTVDFQNGCDGCGILSDGESEMCFDFAPWFDWDVYPWESRESIQEAM